MGASWHYLKDGRPFGPFTLDQMRQLAASGLLSPGDLVQTDPDGGWVPAGAVPDLAFPPGPRPAPPARSAGRAETHPEPHARGVPDEPVPARGADRSLLAMAVVWAAVTPVALVGLGTALAGFDTRLPPAVLAAGGVLALLAWAYLGVRAVLTGALPTFSGRLRRRPLAHRAAGLVILVAGWWLFTALWNGARDRPPAGEARGPGEPVAAPAAYEKVSYEGGEEVLYRPGERAAAERLGAVLRDLGEYDGRSPKTFAVERRVGGWVVKVVMAEAARENPAVRTRFGERVGVRIAALAFPDEAVEFQLCAPDMAAHTVVPIPPAGRCMVTSREVVYYLGAARGDARRLADFLRTRLTGTGDKEFVLARAADAWRLTLLHSSADGLTPDGEAATQFVADDVSVNVFGGSPVEVVLLDRNDRPGRTFRSTPRPPRVVPKTYKGRTVAEWAALLDDADVPTRRVAASALGEFGPGAAPALPGLIRHAGDPDEGVRQCVASALGAVGPEEREVVPALTKLAADPNGYVRKLAVTALGKFGTAAKPAVPALAGLTDRPTDRETRERLAAALGAIDPKDPRAIEALVAILGEDEWADRSPPMDALARAGGEAVPALVAGLKDRKRLYTRWMCVRALGRVGPDAAPSVAALMEQYGSKPDERFGPFPSPGHLAFDSDVVTTLDRIGKPAVSQVIEASRRPEPPGRRLLAAELLSRMKTSPTIRARLIEIVGEGDEGCAGHAARGLGRYGGEAKAAIPQLLRLYRRAAAPHKWSAAEALFQIDPETARAENVKRQPLIGEQIP